MADRLRLELSFDTNHISPMELIATIFAAVSAIAAAIAAFFMFKQTKLATEESRREAKERSELQQRENSLLAVNNRILINQMWNDFNRSVVEGDEGMRTLMGTKNFQDLDPAMVRRVYSMFSTINVVEVGWRLMQAEALPAEQARDLLEDQATLMRNDPEAAEHALTSRGYSRDFLEALWPRVFPDKPLPVRN